VHSSVDATFGAPNKNIGDAFLVVWKCKGGQSVRAVADGALRATVRNVLTVSRSAELATIAKRKTVQDRLPGYTVRLGYSLHYGWAVECAIGSDLKVDTSYLSPHVSLASRLEEATKRYGVDILMTSHTWGLLSPYIQEQCRRITRVMVKGTPVPFELFTYDVPVESSTDAVSTEFVTSSEVTGPQVTTVRQHSPR
jgi:class 3 adenylate cyclase